MDSVESDNEKSVKLILHLQVKPSCRSSNKILQMSFENDHQPSEDEQIIDVL